MAEAAAAITLLTDFGYRDAYVGVLKGVIYAVSPHTRVIDLTHGIPPQDIAAASFNLATSVEYFPANTVHVVVVDPGVGTHRRAVAVRTQECGTIICPDNGVLTGVLCAFGVVDAYELTETSYWRPRMSPGLPSTTFHGRDIFAPVAAHLASGNVDIAHLGQSIDPDTLVTLPLTAPALVQDSGGDYHIEGSVQYIDTYGNVITNIPTTHVCFLAWESGLPERTWVTLTAESEDTDMSLLHVTVRDHVAPYSRTYGEGGIGSLFWLIGSHGYVELAIGSGSASAVTGASVGTPVVCTLAD